MEQFDKRLRQGLMDANLAQYETVLVRLDGWEPDFSPRYCRERMRLLADPWNWVKRRARPAWKRAARNAACILLACTVAFGALMAASPTVRAAVEKWLREFTRNEAHTEVTYYPSQQDETAPQPAWRLAWLPEGWTMSNVIFRPNWTEWNFSNTGPAAQQEAGGGNTRGATLSFSCHSSTSGGTAFGTDEGNWDLRARTTVRGLPADYYEGERTSQLYWTAEDGSLLILNAHGWADQAMLEKIAESAAPWSGDSPSYTANWVPEGHQPRRSAFETAGAGQLQWVERFTTLTFLYVKDPVCPLAVPSRTPEAVTVNGLPGLYWPALIPIEEKGAGISGDPAYTPSMTYPIEDSAVLTWTDPETNTSFQISGILERGDILRMAESVAEISAP